MYRKYLGMYCGRSRTHKRLVVIAISFMLLFAGFEYYYYRTLSNERNYDEVTEPRRARDGTAVSGNVGESTNVQIEKVFRIKTQSPDAVEAEKDSSERKESVNEVCKRLNVSRVMKQYRPKNRKITLQRFNIFHHIIVNEEHKLLYCFIPKVGCSNIKRIFLVMDGRYPSVEKVNHRVMNYEIVRLDNKKFTNEHREYMLDNFYKFMVVRDPFERLVSAYRNKWQNTRNTELHASLGKRIVERYRYNNTKTVETGDDVKFTEYIRYLLDTPPVEVNEHWMRYDYLCRPCEVNYDFVASIDTLARDVRYVMRHIHANETKYYLTGTPKNALVRSKKSTATFLQELPKQDFDKLLAIYKTDHELFGYPLPEYQTLNERYP